VLEEIAYDNGWITREALEAAAASCAKSEYGAHLRKVVEGKIVPQREN
jgi:glucose-1-phosphate thymidylyltransferase